MVDGQQRTRALLWYDKNEDQIKLDFDGNIFDGYEIAVNILSKDLPIEKVREFYVRVNRSGKRLERPELNKAEYFDTTFLKLVNELSDSEQFQSLGIFKDSQIKRMKTGSLQI